MFGKLQITIFAEINALIAMYYTRLIDKDLAEWAAGRNHKPVLLRGARQVGKSTAVRHLGETFEHYIEINFEKFPEFNTLFEGNLDVMRITSQMEALTGKRITPGKTLLFLDEIQNCPEAIMSLRFFKEDLPGLHVIAAGSLLEFALDELPTYGVGRIHSIFMYPMTFDEFLYANGENMLINARNHASIDNPLPEPLHNKLSTLFRTYILVGGMPEAVATWVSSHDFLECQKIQDDIIISYEDDFPKYKRKVDPQLLRLTMRSAAVQCSKKFIFADVGGGYRTEEVKKALEMLILAGICAPVTRTAANGLPLGSESDASMRKILLLDSGLLLRLLNMTLGDISELTSLILTSSAPDLINKGAIAEMIAGLEMMRYQNSNIRHELYFWIRNAKNSQAEVDYVTTLRLQILPIEVKAGMRGGMKSLWIFMREKKLDKAVRCSLENFGSFEYIDNENRGATRLVTICPIYAISMMSRLL